MKNFYRRVGIRVFYFSKRSLSIEGPFPGLSLLLTLGFVRA